MSPCPPFLRGGDLLSEKHMTSVGILKILLFFAIILALTKPVGLFMSRLFQGQRTFLHPSLLAFDASTARKQ